MDIERLEPEGLTLFKPKVFGDDRGFFLESFRQSVCDVVGMTLPFVQDNLSRSVRGTLRGLHFQSRNPQGKMVSVVRGAVFDVAVDIRVGSPTFRHWYGIELNDENHWQLYVPPGFAHGFLVLSEVADFHYKCTDYYRSDDQGHIRWDDPDIGVTWPLERIGLEAPLLSDKDAVAPFLAEL